MERSEDTVVSSDVPHDPGLLSSDLLTVAVSEPSLRLAVSTAIPHPRYHRLSIYPHLSFLK